MKRLNRLLRYCFIDPFIKVERYKRNELVKETVELMAKRIETVDLTCKDKRLVLNMLLKRFDTYLEQEEKKAEAIKQDIKEARK